MESSSKAMVPPPASDLTFVVTTNPDDATSVANKKRVRSVAALKSWPNRRKRAFELNEENVPHPSSSTDDVSKSAVRSGRKPPRKYKYDPDSIVLRTHRSSTDAFQRVNSARSLSPNKSSRRAVEGDEIEDDRPSASTTQPQGGNDTVTATSDESDNASHLSVLITPPTTPRLATRLSKMIEPYNCAPVPHKPWFDEILHHMMTVFAPRGWPPLNISNAEGHMWENWITQHALSEPSLYYVRLLFASGDLIRLGVLRRERSYWLQDKAIQSINEALSDRRRATSDALILAVGRIAVHESIYGDRDAANALHRPAQQRMIAMRGGMAALDYPPLIKRLMRLSDKIMSMQGGTARMLEDEVDNRNFTVAETVEVMEEWVPQQGRSLRQKISIADIINDDGPS